MDPMIDIIEKTEAFFNWQRRGGPKTNFIDATESELEGFLLLCILSQKMEFNGVTTAHSRFLRMLAMRSGKTTPFDAIRSMSGETLRFILSDIRIGVNNTRMNCIETIANIGLDLHSCGAEELMAIKGMGHKTTAMFLSHSREDFWAPTCDVHVINKFVDLQILPEKCRHRGSSISKKDRERARKAFEQLVKLIPGSTASDIDHLLFSGARRG